MSVHELVSAERWLRETLSNDQTLLGFAPGGVFADQAPDGTATPYVIYTDQSGGVDSLTMNAVRVLSNPLYQIVAVAEVSKFDSVASAASYIDDLLKRTNGSTTGGLISACFREEPLIKNETINTQKWKSAGGLYRLQIQQTT